MQVDEDKDIADFVAAQKRARREGIIKFARITVAGGIAAAAGLGVFVALGSLFAEDSYSGRRAGRRAMGSVVLLGFACFAVSTLTFLGAYRLLGGKVDRDTWQTVKDLIFGIFR